MKLYLKDFRETGRSTYYSGEAVVEKEGKMYHVSFVVSEYIHSSPPSEEHFLMLWDCPDELKQCRYEIEELIRKAVLQ